MTARDSPFTRCTAAVWGSAIIPSCQMYTLIASNCFKIRCPLSAGMLHLRGVLGRLAACVAAAPLNAKVAFAAGPDDESDGIGRRGRGRPRGTAAPPDDPEYAPATQAEVRALGSQHLYNAILERLANGGAPGNPAGRGHPRHAEPALPIAAAVNAAAAPVVEALPSQQLYNHICRMLRAEMDPQAPAAANEQRRMEYAAQQAPQVRAT